MAMTPEPDMSTALDRDFRTAGEKADAAKTLPHLTKRDRKAYGQWPPPAPANRVQSIGSRWFIRKARNQQLRNSKRLAVEVRRGSMGMADALARLGIK